MVEDRAVTFALKVEIGVLRQVTGRGFVGGGQIFDDQLVVVRQFVRYLNLQVSWITLFHVLGQIAQFQAAPAVANNGLGVPNDLVETDHAAVQVVFVVVFGQRVCFVSDGELTFGDSVAVTPDDRAEVGLVDRVDIVFHTIVAKRDIAHLAVSVGHDDGSDGRAVVGDLDRHARLVGQCVELDTVEVVDRGFGQRATFAKHGRTETNCEKHSDTDVRLHFFAPWDR